VQLPAALRPSLRRELHAARPRPMQTRRGAGNRRADRGRRPVATPAILKLSVLLKFNTSFAGDCDAQERSRRRSGERTMRRLDRLSRGAQLARWCRSPGECRLWVRRVGLQSDHLLAKRQADRRRKTSKRVRASPRRLRPAQRFRRARRSSCRICSSSSSTL
jgi:hypothetical protein